MCRRNCVRDPSRRCLVKIQVSSVVLIVFVLIHLLYIHTASYDTHERSEYLADNIQQISVKEELTMLSSKNKDESDETEFQQNVLNNSCLHRRNLVFLKTHKTGSTTMNNILLRYAEKHKLVVGLPPDRKWELAGYPGRFNKKFIDPQLDFYNVLCHHFRLDMKEVTQIMPDNTVYITILRDPANAFESGYSFFRDGPFSSWIPNYNNASGLERFLENPEKYYNRSTPWYFRAKNYQAFDLGFDHEREDENYINHIMHTMDKWFHLVMITERFEESLILLKDLLCMDSLTDLIYLRLKVRQNSTRREATTKMKEQMRKWNAIDTRIYNHFLKFLDRKVQMYGQERMKKEVDELNQMISKIEKSCILEYDHADLRPWISRIRLNRNSGEFCEKLSWGEVRFGDFIRKKQVSYANIKLEKQIAPEEMIRSLEIEQKKILT